MSLALEQALQAALAALCPRTYPDVAPEGTATPYIVWHQFGGQAPTYTEAALTNRRNAYVQVNVWADTKAVSAALSLQIEQALVAHTVLQVEPQNALQAEYDEETTLRGSMQDFSIWAPR
jgi:hypothetical protein